MTEHTDVADVLVAQLEALLYLAEEPISAEALAEFVERDVPDVEASLLALGAEFERCGRGLAVRQVAGGWRLSTALVARDAIERFVLAGRSGRLTQAALETLAVVTYKQPIARADVSDIRGVNADGALRSLTLRGLVREVGRAETPGQPILYGTTTLLLEKLGLGTLSELPSIADHLPEQAPDEPRLDDLSRARRLLAEGRDLPATGSGSWDPDVPSMPAPQVRQREADNGMDDLSARLEAAAKSATARLKHVVNTTDPDDPADDEAAPQTSPEPTDGDSDA
ncbi:MAG: segregation and condensation protein B [Glaciecola sp.]|jgi:segregation and condensation protein B